MGLKAFLGRRSHPPTPRPTPTVWHKWKFGGMRGKIPVMICERGCPVVWWPWEHEDLKGNCDGRGPGTVSVSDGSEDARSD